MNLFDKQVNCFFWRFCSHRLFRFTFSIYSIFLLLKLPASESNNFFSRLEPVIKTRRFENHHSKRTHAALLVLRLFSKLLTTSCQIEIAFIIYILFCHTSVSYWPFPNPEDAARATCDKTRAWRTEIIENPKACFLHFRFSVFPNVCSVLQN